MNLSALGRLIRHGAPLAGDVYQMRNLLVATSAALGLFAVVGTAEPVKAEVLYPWCSTLPDNSGIRNCSFNTLAQCQATISGIGGRCLANPQVRLDRDSRYLEAPLQSPRASR